MPLLLKYSPIGSKLMRALNLNEQIYDKDVVCRAVSDYETLADITISCDNGRIQLQFSNCAFDEGVTVHEFENYLIDLMNA